MLKKTILLLNLSLLLHAEEPLQQLESAANEPINFLQETSLSNPITESPILLSQESSQEDSKLAQNSLALEVSSQKPFPSSSLIQQPSFTNAIISNPISSTTSDFLAPSLKKSKSPMLAAFLSTLVPGCGHYYLGDYRSASEILGGSVLSGTAVFASRNDPDLFFTSIATLQAVNFYGIYAAYRDAKIHNGTAPVFLPRENFKALSAAPFQWSILKKPEVWGGVLGSLVAGSLLVYFAYPEIPQARFNTSYVMPLSAVPIAVGEESLFRGFLQSAFLENLPAWGAITLSSLLFGAAHIPNAINFEPSERKLYFTFAVPFLSGLGAYMGWLSYKNHSLKESVAFHAWYDFTLLLGSVLVNQATIRKQTNLSYSFEF